MLRAVVWVSGPLAQAAVEHALSPFENDYRTSVCSGKVAFEFWRQANVLTAKTHRMFLHEAIATLNRSPTFDSTAVIAHYRLIDHPTEKWLLDNKGFYVRATVDRSMLEIAHEIRASLQLSRDKADTPS